MMLKVVAFLVTGVVVVALAWGLAGIPGHVSISIGQFTVETSTSFAILLLVAFVLTIVLVLRILQALKGVPRSGAGWRRRRRFALGQKSVTRVLVALAAGEQVAARKEARRARYLLGDSPQTLLLIAEANRLSGREGEAEEAFRALAKQPDARFLGLRGLLRQAVDRQDWPGALTLAKEAEAAHPGTLWLRQQRAELALQTENWSEAIELVGPDARRPAYYVAAADAEPDQARALHFARQAWKQDRLFAPAALAYARRLRAVGNEKRARTCITEAWRQAPHPDLAEFALSLEPDKLARARAAKLLVSRNPTHIESRILLARVALDAGLTGEARHQIEALQADGLMRRGVCLLLAEVEEQERGDTEAGRLAQREALRQATVADPDPHWQCATCHTDHASWRPKCDVCGGVATIQWVDGSHISKLPVLAGPAGPSLSS